MIWLIGTVYLLMSCSKSLNLSLFIPFYVKYMKNISTLTLVRTEQHVVECMQEHKVPYLQLTVFNIKPPALVTSFLKFHFIELTVHVNSLASLTVLLQLMLVLMMQPTLCRYNFLWKLNLSYMYMYVPALPRVNHRKCTCVNHCVISRWSSYIWFSNHIKLHFIIPIHFLLKI